METPWTVKDRGLFLELSHVKDLPRTETAGDLRGQVKASHFRFRPSSKNSKANWATC
jgi:hypothetical protein